MTLDPEGITPDQTKRWQGISFNASMIDHDPELLTQRLDFHVAAYQELVDTFVTARKEEDEKYQPPDFFDKASLYAITLSYQSFAQAYNRDDILRLIEVEGQRTLREDADSWVPKTEEELDLVAKLIYLTSRLSDEDNEAAFQPHIKGRPQELVEVDAHKAWYNKFGALLSNRYGFTPPEEKE